MSCAFPEVRNALSKQTAIDLDDEHYFLRESSCVTHYLLEDTMEEEYQFRNEEQYYIFLLQQYFLTSPNLISCQFCGRYFTPKTRKLTRPHHPQQQNLHEGGG